MMTFSTPVFLVFSVAVHSVQKLSMILFSLVLIPNRKVRHFFMFAIRSAQCLLLDINFDSPRKHKYSLFLFLSLFSCTLLSFLFILSIFHKRFSSCTSNFTSCFYKKIGWSDNLWQSPFYFYDRYLYHDLFNRCIFNLCFTISIFYKASADRYIWDYKRRLLFWYNADFFLS